MASRTTGKEFHSGPVFPPFLFYRQICATLKRIPALWSASPDKGEEILAVLVFQQRLLCIYMTGDTYSFIAVTSPPG
jgi:hypothetical protein